MPSSWRFVLCLFGLFGCLLIQRPAKAWLFHEHHDLGIQAVHYLSAERRGQLEALWSAWRTEVKHGSRLCQAPAAGSSRRACAGEACSPSRSNQAEIVDCVDFAMLPAIAADHSCSPQELGSLLAAEWLRKVIRLSFRTRNAIDNAVNDDQRVDAWHNSHVENEMADRDYLSRADANSAHFMLVRQIDDTLKHYAWRAADPSSPVNAIGLYIAYHRAALDLGAQLSALSKGSPGYGRLLEQALMTEAFALHFLQDSFSAGHTVGTWGTSPERMGTHDFYCSHGIDAETWSGERYSASGDGHLEPKDSRWAVPAIAESIGQVLDAIAGRLSASEFDSSFRDGLAALEPQLASQLIAYNVCTATKLPQGIQEFAHHQLSLTVLNQTIRPGLGEDDAHLPRFRNEVGLFANFYSGVRVGGNFGGYQSPGPLYAPRLRGDLEVGFGLGYGLEGVVSQATDGVVFAQLIGTAQSEERDLVCPAPCDDDRTWGTDTYRVPSKIGLGVRLRVPNLLLPGDILLAAPIAMLFDFHTGKKLALMAANGGVGRLWKRSGRGQFVLGREVGLRSVGWPFGDPKFHPEIDSTGNQPQAQTYQSFEVDLPIYEYRPFRRFTTNQTSTLLMQAGTSIDINPFGTAWLVYARFGLDGRLYF